MLTKIPMLIFMSLFISMLTAHVFINLGQFASLFLFKGFRCQLPKINRTYLR